MEAPIWPFHLGKPHCQFVEHVGGESFWCVLSKNICLCSQKRNRRNIWSPFGCMVESYYNGKVFWKGDSIGSWKVFVFCVIWKVLLETPLGIVVEIWKVLFGNTNEKHQ